LDNIVPKFASTNQLEINRNKVLR